MTVFSEIREESIAVCAVHLFMANACLSHEPVRGVKRQAHSQRKCVYVCVSCGVSFSINTFIMRALLSEKVEMCVEIRGGKGSSKTTMLLSESNIENRR